MAIIREAAAAGVLTGSRQEITLITPGWGSSGYYSPAVLEQAAKDRVFPAKTQMHIDHDGEMSRYEQPAGSLTRFAAGLTEDARWEPNWVDPDKPGELPGRLVAEAKVMPNWREFLHAASEFIGTSVSSAAAFAKGEVDGRKGNVVEALIADPLNRVDYVTVAGRGGKISAVLESAINRRATEATANELRELIRDAIRAQYGAEDTWIWLRDYDDTTAWFEVEDAETTSVYEQAYTSTDTAVALTGDRIEVRATTQYVPVAPAAEAAPDSPSNPAGATTNQEEANMATIDDKELAELRESAGRATALEAELNTERAIRADEAKAARKDKAESIVKEAFGDDVPAFFLTAATMLSESADFDAEKFRTEATEAAAKIAADNGAGTPRGVGQTSKVLESKTITSESIVSALHGKVA